MKKSLYAAVAVPIAWVLSGCTAAQREVVSSEIQIACSDVMPLTQIAALVPGANSIAAGVNIGCTTAEGIARLAADPTSAVWLGQQKQMLTDLAKRAGLKIAAAR